jgi:hypothetical protein
MKTNAKLWLAGGLAAALVTLTACSGGSDSTVVGNQPQTGPGSVPDSAGTSVGGFIAFLKGLSQTDETSEPLVIKDSFAVPADETGVPEPLV